MSTVLASTGYGYLAVSPISANRKKQAWVVYFELINILTDLALIILPTLNISRIQTSWDKKLMAIAFFSARIVYVLQTTSGKKTANNRSASFRRK